jgi:hypothetical protein
VLSEGDNISPVNIVTGHVRGASHRITPAELFGLVATTSAMTATAMAMAMES